MMTGTFADTDATATADTTALDIIVISFPNEAAANAVEPQVKNLWFLSSLSSPSSSPSSFSVPKNVIENTKVVTTFDPYNAKCGSGGGTLAAIEVAKEHTNKTQPTALILHAGGESSRCPTQRIIGKAWTTLPSSHLSPSSSIVSETTTNPTLLLLSQLIPLCHLCLPKGSVVVAATDTILHLTKDWVTLQNEMLATKYNNEKGKSPHVIGVAVPAPLEIAQNHGVYVMNDDDNNSKGNDKKSCKTFLKPPQKVLQKPKLSILQSNPSFQVDSILTDGNKPSDSPPQAWIDTGIVIFLPHAVNVLNELVVTGSDLSKCTRQGLQNLFQRHHPTKDITSQQQDLIDFAQVHANKIDLYTDILHSLSWPQNDNDIHDASATTSRSDWQKSLSQLELQVLCFGDGSFLHLGTTRELVEFWIYSTMPAIPCTTPVQERYKWFGQQVLDGCNNRVATNYQVANNNESDIAVVAMETYVSDCSKISIGSQSVLECCWLDTTAHNPLQVGKECYLSGWRPNIYCSIPIPDQMVIQVYQMPHHVVLMIFGLTDDIKQAPMPSLFNIPWNDLSRSTNIEPSRIWKGDETATPNNGNNKNNIWCAKVLPIIPCSSGESIDVANYIAWWVYRAGTKSNNITLTNQTSAEISKLAKDSYELFWNQTTRISLQELSHHVNAQDEFQFRSELSARITKYKKENWIELEWVPFLTNEQDRIDWTWMYTATTTTANAATVLQALKLQKILQCANNIVQDYFSKHDNSSHCLIATGRIWRIISTFLADLGCSIQITVSTEDKDNNDIKSKDAWNTLCDCYKKCETILQSPWNDKQRQIQTLEQTAALQDDFILHFLCVRSTLQDDLCALSDFYESLATAMTRHCTLLLSENFTPKNSDNSIDDTIVNDQKEYKVIFDKWVIATAPARVDISGGWSDTPPICWEFGAAVSGMAVKVDGYKPLSCRCRLIHSETPSIWLQSDARCSDNGEITSSFSTCIKTVQDLLDGFNNPNSDCSLHKAALITLGLLPIQQALDYHQTTINSNIPTQNQQSTLKSLINQFCQIDDNQNFQLQIITTSLLPQGSGMGTSSILGGCVLAAIAQCVGRPINSNDFTDKRLMHAVLIMEQLLTSGGGFQDQVHGLIGGIKLVSSKRQQLPLSIDVTQIIPTSLDFENDLEQRLILLYTGKTRLAKNILQSVLRRWARQTPEIVNTVSQLIQTATASRIALEKNNSIVELAKCLNLYWKQKKHMAGDDSGVEPVAVRIVIDTLLKQKAILGASLCGAGGGGFMILIAADGYDKNHIYSIVQSEVTPLCSEANDFTWHSCHICKEGLKVTTIQQEQSAICHEEFDLSWHTE